MLFNLSRNFYPPPQTAFPIYGAGGESNTSSLPEYQEGYWVDKALPPVPGASEFSEQQALIINDDGRYSPNAPPLEALEESEVWSAPLSYQNDMGYPPSAPLFLTSEIMVEENTDDPPPPYEDVLNNREGDTVSNNAPFQLPPAVIAQYNNRPLPPPPPPMIEISQTNNDNPLPSAPPYYLFRSGN